MIVDPANPENLYISRTSGIDYTHNGTSAHDPGSHIRCRSGYVHPRINGRMAWSLIRLAVVPKAMPNGSAWPARSVSRPLQ
jgi:hypothetical protein